MFVTNFDGLTIYRFIWKAVNSNTYVLVCQDSVLIVDPVDSGELYQFVLQHSFRDALILLTHEHFDHICGLNYLRKILPKCCVLASKQCSENIQLPNKNLSNYVDVFLSFIEKREVCSIVVDPFQCAAADNTFEITFSYRWKEHALQLFECAGHSKGSICCILDEKIMFSGDTLLPIPTVTQLPGGRTAKFWLEDVPKLEELVGKIEMVFPGHEMPGRLEDMLAVNVRPARYKKCSTSV